MSTASAKSVPFKLVEIFGLRPVIEVKLNGVPHEMVLHSNAGFTSQLSHKQADRVGVDDLQYKDQYGIAKRGKLSDLGRSEGILREVSVGDQSFEHVAVSVFETLSREEAEVETSHADEGMLGLPFLWLNKVVLDYGSKIIDFGTTANRDLSGYTSIPLHRDEKDGRFLAEFVINGQKGNFVISTVSHTHLDERFALQAGLANGPTKGDFGGPAGGTGVMRSTPHPMVVQHGSWKSKPYVAEVFDIYAYMSTSAPEDASTVRSGNLAADLWIEHKAIIDFGQSLLYVK